MKPDAADHQVVALVRLNELLEATATVGVMKIDVERHELAVLEGSEALLRCCVIRDIVFEEHRPYRNATELPGAIRVLAI